MTIQVSITRTDEGSHDNLQVAIVTRDIYGNDAIAPGQLFQVEPGETKTFWLHRTQSLRVYESALDLV